MSIKQISVVIENKKGTLAKLTDFLISENIDIRAISVFDTVDFGLARLVVDRPEKALELLKEAGYASKISKVIGIEPEDELGSLNTIFKLFSKNDINIEYIYSCVMRKREMPYIVVHVDDDAKAIKVLEANGIKVVGDEQ